MPFPQALQGALTVPAIGSPMFLVSFPPLVKAQCRAGIAGCFPHVNARTTEQLDQWFVDIKTDLQAHQESHPQQTVAPWGINLVLHNSNQRLAPDLERVVEHQVPLVLTSLGHPGKVVEQIHAYGGLVLCDVVNAEHARKAAHSGVDGLICIGGGAGGHASTQSSFSLVREIREFWDGLLVLGGAINDGFQIRSAEMLGADLAYMGTRFIASQESNASNEYRQMVVDATVNDLVYTDRLSGIGCNYLRPTLERYDIDPDTLPAKAPDLSALTDENAKLWRDIWTAGHGVATIHDVPSVGEIVSRLRDEYLQACAIPPSSSMTPS